MTGWSMPVRFQPERSWSTEDWLRSSGRTLDYGGRPFFPRWPRSAHREPLALLSAKSSFPDFAGNSFSNWINYWGAAHIQSAQSLAEPCRYPRAKSVGAPGARQGQGLQLFEI